VDFVVDAGGRLKLFEAKWMELPDLSDTVNLDFVRNVIGKARVTAGGVVSRTWAGSTPKLIMTAMSRVFSITIMVSAMRMLSAATMTMSAITMKVTTCSSLRARKSSRFCSIQLVVM
jgi:hypothetical protein